MVIIRYNQCIFLELFFWSTLGSPSGFRDDKSKIMTPQRIQALFDFIDYLDSNKKEYVEKYVPLCNELKNLHNQKNELRPDKNYKDKQQYDSIQNLVTEKFSPIEKNIYNPISSKLRELEIWSGDKTYASIWNNNYSAISDFKENFTSEDILQVMQYKQKYLSFRRETDTDFLCLTFAFHNLDEILKELFNFFKDTNENEFDGFEAKTIEVNNMKEAVTRLIENKGQNVKISIPFKTVYDNPIEEQKRTNSTNIKNEIVMGDKIQVGNISSNSGQISVGKDNTNKISGSDEVAKKSFHWQKWGIIAASILTIIAILVAIIIG